MKDMVLSVSEHFLIIEKTFSRLKLYMANRQSARSVVVTL